MYEKFCGCNYIKVLSELSDEDIGKSVQRGENYCNAKFKKWLGAVSALFQLTAWIMHAHSNGCSSHLE